MNIDKDLDFEAFLQFCQAQGIAHVVVRETHEIRPSYGAEHSVIIGPVHSGVLVAYHKGTLGRCSLPGDALAPARERLSEAGIRMKEVSGNIT